jgi:GR25 family glycosyltransferase involved in LPS biosynthesis
MISLILKHFLAYREIADKYDEALILEDDVILSNSFSESLKTYMLELPDDYDMLFIGDGCHMHIEENKIVPGKYIYEKCLHPTPWVW